jgi:hypothetical protein
MERNILLLISEKDYENLRYLVNNVRSFVALMKMRNYSTEDIREYEERYEEIFGMMLRFQDELRQNEIKEDVTIEELFCMPEC